MQKESQATRWGDTAEAAAIVRNKPHTLRRHLCVSGHFYGIRPTKTPGGRLLWPLSQIERLAAGEPVTGPSSRSDEGCNVSGGAA
jgi:hypothetical protein